MVNIGRSVPEVAQVQMSHVICRYPIELLNDNVSSASAETESATPDVPKRTEETTHEEPKTGALDDLYCGSAVG